jgi:phytoene dehydrogenase-like protein
MKDFDAIVVGAGMGGLSAAAFLSMAGMKVAVFEKHDKPGGYATSFSLHGVRFDAGLEALPELAPEDALGSFLSLWGIQVPSIVRQENVRVLTDVGDYTFRDASLVEDFRAAFPDRRREVDAFFRINRRMVDGMMAGGPPKAPQEMSLLDKLAFGVRSMTKNPDMIRFGLKNGHAVIGRTLGGGELGAAILAKVFYDVVYLSYAYRWEQVRRRRLLYPVGGMQALSDAVAGVTLARAGRLFLKNGVRRILVEAGRAVGVEDETGSVHRADVVICNAPLPHALGSLLAGVNALDPLRKAVARRAIFPSAALVFLGLDASYDPGGHYTALSPSFESCRRGAWTEKNVPLALVTSSGWDGGPVRPAFIMATLGHEYADHWASGPNGERGKAYRELKDKVARIFVDRLAQRLPKGFRDAIRFSVPATPLTLERYTGNTGGSFMGFHCRVGEYGRFFPQTSAIDGLYFSGQWVFPGFGVAGVAASGYFCAKTALEKAGVDLMAIMTAGRKVVA